MTSPFRYLLFDLDNTILDFDYASHCSYQGLMKNLGEVNLIDNYTDYSRINRSVWKQMEEGGIDQIEVRTRRWQLFWEHFDRKHNPLESNNYYLDQLAENGKWIRGMKTLLRDLSINGIEIHIITNGFREVQRKRLQKEGINKIAKSITISDEIGYSKPDKRFFDFLFSNQTQLKKEKCLVIGDSLESDIKGGNDYGLSTCWYNPHKNENQSTVLPTYEIDNVDELRRLIGI